MDHHAVDEAEADNQDLDKDYLLYEPSSDGKGMQKLGSAMKILARVDFDLAYSSEKLVNLHILLMHALTWEHEFEAMAMKNDECILEDSIEKALVFDFLIGILDSEVRDLDSFMISLQTEIIDAHQKIFSCRHLKEMFCVMKEKLHDSEESWKKSEEQVLEMKMLSTKLQTTLLAFGQNNWKVDKGMDLSESCQVSTINANSKTQTAEQQRHSLRMLERSLARELDLEMRLLNLREHEEELKLKLHYTEQVAFQMEEAAEHVWGRTLEAENAAAVLMGVSKELLGRLQIVQFNLNGSFQRESDSKYKLQDIIDQLKAKEAALQKLERSSADANIFHLENSSVSKENVEEAESKCIAVNSEVLTLKEKVKLLEAQLKESETRLESEISFNEASKEKLSTMENVIESLQESIFNKESRAQSAESKVALLTETNLELTEELGFLKGSDNNTEKVSLLEKKLRDVEIQLQHAKASSEASQEQQNMLYSAIWDMETLIEDLKSKVSKAESKTESAEEQCNILSENNFELDKEASHLRSRIEFLEASLNQANNEKVENARDISIRGKLIMDMSLQLAVERERIQKQLLSLSKENKILVEQLYSTTKDASAVMPKNVDDDDKVLLISTRGSHNTHLNISKEAAMESSPKCFQAGG